MVTESNSAERPTLAVLGAGGFVGSRLLQMISMCGRGKATPVLRSFRGLARLGVAVPEACITDTQDLAALSKAFHGCKTVVILTMGDQVRILDDTQLIYAACVKAGVGQLIHVSSAVVFGRVIDPSIDDDSPPDTDSWLLYARGKAKAEVWLREQFSKQSIQIVVLRPGQIWGPGSNWSEMVGDQLIHGNAALSNGGKGIANLIFVDNLVRLIMTVSEYPNGPSGFYNAADAETVTWQDYYAGLAALLGYPPDAVCLWGDARLRIRASHIQEWVMQRPPLHRFVKGLVKQLGPAVKAALLAKLRGPPVPPGGNGGPPGPPILSRGLWETQNTLHPLPAAKFYRDFGPVKLIPFENALDTTAAWLRFSGFAAPVASPDSHRTMSLV